MGSLVNPTLPTIHFSGKNLEPGSTPWLSTSKDVVRALEEYGCFVAIYEKFPREMHEAIFRASEELFDLPTDVKVQNTSDTPSHGYVGQEPIIPLYEGLGIENATTHEGVEKFTNLLWPSGNDRFRETALEYSRLVAKLDQMVMRMVSESYGIESSYESLLGATSCLLRIIKYRKPEEGESGLGIVPHTDKSFMTILHQCQGWTNGRIEPSIHRVTIKGSEERYSLGLFTFIRDLKIQVPEELVDDHHPAQFNPFDHYKFIHFYYTEEGRKSKCPLRAYCGV
ncbi:UNVERIFIED_CONTAM: putative 2-oxoglutarate-dependent dioxygenase AOP1.2 [Sesamum latifolium]|uniref:2-oxoglutarate-dependent dioxygenase AOP1.2 n=1 Tax=Sesamum latifolium TaxID=2727402 RepID=A0AAW2UEW9_9LAMI